VHSRCLIERIESSSAAPKKVVFFLDRMSDILAERNYIGISSEKGHIIRSYGRRQRRSAAHSASSEFSAAPSSATLWTNSTTRATRGVVIVYYRIFILNDCLVKLRLFASLEQEGGGASKGIWLAPKSVFFPGFCRDRIL